MVFEKLISKKAFKIILYSATALIEILGILLLFSKDVTIKFITNNSVLVSLIIIIFGYFSAVSVRRKN